MRSRAHKRDSSDPAVLIVADDADFAQSITSRWQAEPRVPSFTLMTGDLCPGIHPQVFDVAIVTGVRAGVLPSVLTILEAVGKPVIFVAASAHEAATVNSTSIALDVMARDHRARSSRVTRPAPDGS